MNAEASSSTARVSGLDETPAITSTSSRTTLEVPTDTTDGLAEAKATTDFGGVTVVALATVLPAVSASAGIQQPDGSVTPLPMEGMPLGDGRLLPSTESGTGFSRAGVVFERTDPSGTVERSTVALTSVQLLGVFESAPPPDTAPVGAATAPLTAATPVLGAPALRAGSNVVAAPPTAAGFVVPDPGRPVLASANAAERFGRVRERLWLLWVYAGWLALGALVMTAGRRYLAPHLAAQAAADRRARAGRVDHLDDGGLP
jgi:hypothetical protein